MVYYITTDICLVIFRPLHYYRSVLIILTR